MIEEWKVYSDNRYCKEGKYKGRRVPGHLWEVSNYGRVRKDGIIINLPEPNVKCQYYKIGGFYVHRAVTELFIGKIPEGYEVEHIDCNKLNNRVDNLRIVTHIDNMHNPITIKNHYKSTHTELFCNKISKIHKGKTVTKETKQKQSEGRLKYLENHNSYWTGKEAHNKGKKLVLCDDGKRHWK